MVKTHHLSINQYYSILKKIQATPSILSGSDQLTIYIIAKGLLEGLQDAGDLKKLFITLEKKPAYRYFTQSDFMFTNMLYEELDNEFETSDPQAFSDTEYEVTDTKQSIGEKNSNLIKIYSSLKLNKGKRKHTELLQCLWIVYEFLDSINFDVLNEVFVHLKQLSIDESILKEILAELESYDFIYIDNDNILSWDIPLNEIFENEEHQYLLDNLKELIPLFSKLKELRLLLYLGAYFYSNDFFEDATICYRQIIQNANDKKDKKLIAGSYNNLGLSLAGMKKFGSACEKYEKATKIDSEYAQPHYNWGAVLLRLKKFEDACQKYEKAITIEPSYINAYFDYGVCLQELKKFDDAHEKYKNAIRLNPNYVDAYNNDGNVLVELERYEEACVKYRKAIEINPEFAGAYYNLGRTLPKISYYETNPKKIFELFLKAFFLFIIRGELEFAYKIATLNILKESDHAFLKNAVFIFNVGVDLVLNPNKKQTNARLKNLKEFKKKTIKIENRLVTAASIVIDAILKNKKPDLKKDSDIDGFSLRAAIVLANEIVSKPCPDSKPSIQ